MNELLVIVLIMLGISFILTHIIIFWLTPYIFLKSKHKSKKDEDKLFLKLLIALMVALILGWLAFNLLYPFFLN